MHDSQLPLTLDSPLAGDDALRSASDVPDTTSQTSNLELRTTDAGLQTSPLAPLVSDVPLTAPPPDAVAPTSNAWTRMWHEVTSGLQTLVSAAVYATLIVTFGFQVARVDGLSMAPTLEDHDRLRSEEHTSELQSRQYLVCRLLLEKKKNKSRTNR